MEVADDNLKFDKCDREFSKRIENTVGKGEMNNFSYSNSVFQRIALQTCENKGLLGKGLTTAVLVTVFSTRHISKYFLLETFFQIRFR